MSKLNEEWRDVVGYEGLYEVSDWGNVRSCDRTYEYYHPSAKKNIRRTFKGQLLKKILNSDGYHVVCLHDKNHKQHEGKVHQLVAIAWIPNPENKKEVGHTKTLLNGLEDKTANEAWNLQWMTREENANYGTLTQRLSESKMGDKNPMYGKQWSEGTRAKLISKKKKNWIEHPEYFEALKNSNKHSDKIKIKVNQNNKITGEFIRTWDSAADVEKELGIWHGNIAACCKGKVKSAGGFKWSYTND